MTTIDDLLAAARARFRRIDPWQAWGEQRTGALLIDIRPHAQRMLEGEVPGSLAIERNVLEWRLDPACSARIPEASSHSRRIILLCQQGYTSSLAAASLHDLGLINATDVIGGLCAWRAEGLPVVGGVGRKRVMKSARGAASGARK